MTDTDIIDRYFARDEQAIRMTAQQYGAASRSLALRILKNPSDAEECVNDSYYRLWDRIPPDRPQSLWAYLSAIIRNLALDRLRETGSLKRGGSAVTVALDELTQVTGPDNVEDRISARELARAVDRFLRTQRPLAQEIFLQRYVYFASRSEIAARCGISSAQVSVQLSRTRKRLAKYLQQEGYL